jgi:hypothetical protein
MWTKVWDAAFEFLRTLDPCILAMISTILGLVLKPATVQGYRAIWWGVKTAGGGVRWLFITPEPGVEAANLIRKFDWRSEWSLGAYPNQLRHHSGTIEIDLNGKAIKVNDVNVAKRFNRHDRKRIFNKAKEKYTMLLDQQQHLAMVGLRG